MGDRRRHSQLLRHDPTEEVNQGDQEESSGQGYQRPALEIPACRGDAQGDHRRNPYRDTPRGNCYTSYKVANLLVEFSTSIPRTQLRPSYGDGFLGAPLQTGQPLEHPTPQEQGDQRGSSSTHTQQHPGSAPHV